LHGGGQRFEPAHLHQSHPSWESRRLDAFESNSGSKDIRVKGNTGSWERPAVCQAAFCVLRRHWILTGGVQGLDSTGQWLRPLGRRCRLSTLTTEQNASSQFRKYMDQATKGVRWMPWRQEPKKDVDGCEKPRGAVIKRYIRGYPNGETRSGEP
jgi:hypothetical protein